MSRNAEGLRMPTHLFEAAAWRYNVKVYCSRCPKTAIFTAAGLWYRFQRKGWDDDLRHVRARVWCRDCSFQTGKRVRPKRLALTKKQQASCRLPEPADSEWKNAVSRY